MFGSRNRSARAWTALTLAAILTAWSGPSFAVHPSAEARWRNPYCPDGECTTHDPFGYWPTKWGRWPGAAKQEKLAQEEVERRAIVKPKQPVPVPATPTDTETTPTERQPSAPGGEENPFEKFYNPTPRPNADEQPGADNQPPMSETHPMDESSPRREPSSTPEDSTPDVPGLVPIPTSGPTLEQDQDDQANPFLPNDEDKEKSPDPKEGASSSRRRTNHHAASGGSRQGLAPRRLPPFALTSKPLNSRVDGRRVATTPSRTAELARHRASAIASEQECGNPLRRDLEGTQTFERAPAPGRQQAQRPSPVRSLVDPATSNPLRLASASENEPATKDTWLEDNSPSSTVNPLRSK